MLRAGALGRPRGMGWGGRWEGGSGWRTHVNPWLIHVNLTMVKWTCGQMDNDKWTKLTMVNLTWQKPLQYCKVISLQLIKIKIKKKTCLSYVHGTNLEDTGHIYCPYFHILQQAHTCCIYLFPFKTPQ